MTRVPIDERLWSRVREDAGTGCWVYTGLLSQYGYGQIDTGGADGRTRCAHIVAYELVVGRVPAGLVLDHTCRNRACVNPAHLEPVTARENVLRSDAPSALNARKTHCPLGHPLSGANLIRRADRRGRGCRECQRAATRAWRARKAAA